MCVFLNEMEEKEKNKLDALLYYSLLFHHIHIEYLPWLSAASDVTWDLLFLLFSHYNAISIKVGVFVYFVLFYC